MIAIFSYKLSPLPRSGWFILQRSLSKSNSYESLDFIVLGRSKKEEIETGMPAEDEYVKLAKIFAGNQAFHFSFYLWVIIFIFNDSFSKNETMLGIGILGSAFIYGVSLWYNRSTGEFNE